MQKSRNYENPKGVVNMKENLKIGDKVITSGSWSNTIEDFMTNEIRTITKIRKNGQVLIDGTIYERPKSECYSLGEVIEELKSHMIQVNERIVFLINQEVLERQQKQEQP
jgi:hypothetical protein